MKKFTILFTLVISLATLKAQSWDWGKAGTGGDFNSIISGFSIATDKKGDCIVTGVTEGIATFGSYSLGLSGDQTAFVVKYDSLGNILWASFPTITSNNYSNNDIFSTKVAADRWGNIYLTGSFDGGFSFGGTDTIGSAGETFFIAKYSPNGNVLWVRQATNQNLYSINKATAITTDNMGNGLVTGIFFDTLTFGSITLYPSIRAYNTFVFKFDSVGNALWGQTSKTPSTSCLAEPSSMCTDVTGNIFITGVFRTDVFWGTQQLVSLNSYSGFLVKYSPAGNIVWAKQSDNITFLNSNVYPGSVCADNEGSAYITGNFYDSVEFGTTKLYSSTIYSSFLAKYDSGGNEVWAEQTNQGWQTTGLVSDASNNIFLTATNISLQCGCGPFNESEITMGTYTMNVIPWVAFNSTLIKFDKNGNGICGSYLAGTGDMYPQVTSDSSGKHIFFSGYISNGDSVYCGKDTLYYPTENAVLTARWLDCKATVGGIEPESSINSSVTIYPNPSTGIFTITFRHPELVSGSQTIEVYNVLGEKIFTEIRQPVDDYLINLARQPSGIYLYRVLSADNALLGEGKLVIEK